MIDFKEKANLIWKVADLLRGDYKQSDYFKGHCRSSDKVLQTCNKRGTIITQWYYVRLSACKEHSS